MTRRFSWRHQNVKRSPSQTNSIRTTRHHRGAFFTVMFPPKKASVPVFLTWVLSRACGWPGSRSMLACAEKERHMVGREGDDEVGTCQNCSITDVIFSSKSCEFYGWRLFSLIYNTVYLMGFDSMVGVYEFWISQGTTFFHLVGGFHLPCERKGVFPSEATLQRAPFNSPVLDLSCNFSMAWAIEQCRRFHFIYQ